MQIGLAKTPMMHVGIASMELGFIQCTLLFSFCYTTRTYIQYAYNALSLTFTPYQYISLSHTGRTHPNAVRGRGLCYFCVILLFPHCVKLPSAWLWYVLSATKLLWVERRMTRAVDRGGEDANQERKFCAKHVTLLLIAAKKCLAYRFLQ